MVKNTVLLIMNFNTPGYSQFSVFKYKQTSKQTLMMSQHFGDEKPVRWFFFHVLRIIMQNLKCWKGFKNVFPLPSNLTVTPKVYATVNNKITTEMCMTWKFEKKKTKPTPGLTLSVIERFILNLPFKLSNTIHVAKKQ